jgi:hypothetical protein
VTLQQLRGRAGQQSAPEVAQAERALRLEAKAVAKLDELESRDDLTRSEIEQKKATVQAAIERARARRAGARPKPAPTPAREPSP